jgi:hypothetical protein
VAAARVPGSARSRSTGERRRPTAPRSSSQVRRSGASGPISLPAASRRFHSSRSRCTNGMAARCRAAAALATGGPKSLISWLTGSSAC